jgi:hypothetical protein
MLLVCPLASSPPAIACLIIHRGPPWPRFPQFSEAYDRALNNYMGFGEAGIGMDLTTVGGDAGATAALGPTRACRRHAAPTSFAPAEPRRTSTPLFLWPL